MWSPRGLRLTGARPKGNTLVSFKLHRPDAVIDANVLMGVINR